MCRYPILCTNWHLAKCRLKVDSHHFRHQVPAVLWWTEAPMYHSAYSCLHQLYQVLQAASGSGLGSVLYQTHDDRINAIISYASRILTKAETHYASHKLEFLTLQWAVVEKLHEYLYGSMFDVYTGNNPLMYILNTAKLDTVSHCWVASLANYNFQLYYRVGKTNVNVDALVRAFWPMCVPNASGTHHWVSAVAVWTMQEATLKGPGSPIEAYSCNLHVMDLVGDGMQVTCMTTKDCWQAQLADPILDYVIAGWDLGPVTIQADWLTKVLTAPLWMQPPQPETGHPVQKSSAKRVLRGTLSVGIATAHRETALEGCHNEIGH